jgi:plastocyanin
MLILVITTLAMSGFAGYLYFYNSDLAKTDIFKKVEEQFTRTKTKNDWIEAPAEVTLTKDGFVPAILSITAGQQVTFINTDDNAHRIIPYPLATRNLLPDLDSENLQPTDSFTYAFENRGTYTISESMNPGKYKALLIVD